MRADYPSSVPGHVWWTFKGNRYAMDPAAILGHELVHVWMKLFAPEMANTDVDKDEQLELEFQEQIQRELDEQEGAYP